MHVKPHKQRLRIYFFNTKDVKLVHLSILLPQSIPPEYQEKAEEIRAYLVQIRGGAPFLSGADAKLLVQWLDEKIPVVAILAAIDQVSIRRRGKTVKSRLSLSKCKGTLGKLLKKSTPKTRKAIAETGLATLISSIQQIHVSAQLESAKNSLLHRMKELGKEQNADPEQQGKKAIQACLEFHEAAWIAAEDEHEKLQIEAEEELEDLSSIFSPMKWKEAVEEVMRSKLRMRYPAISAQQIWNALNQSSLG